MLFVVKSGGKYDRLSERAGLRGMGNTTMSNSMAKPIAGLVQASIAALGLSLLMPSGPAAAQGLPLIRDTEIENQLGPKGS